MESYLVRLALRVARRYSRGPLAVPGVRSYELAGGPPGFTLDLDIPESGLKGIRAEVGVWVRDTPEEALSGHEKALLKAVSGFTRARAAWTGSWHQNGELWLRSVEFS